MKKVYNIIIYVHYVTNNVLSRDSNYIVNVTLWEFDREKSIFLRGVLGSSSIIWTGSDTKYGLEFWYKYDKRVEAKSQKFEGLICTFLDVIAEKLVKGGVFCPPLSWAWLRTVIFWKIFTLSFKEKDLSQIWKSFNTTSWPQWKYQESS